MSAFKVSMKAWGRVTGMLKYYSCCWKWEVSSLRSEEEATLRELLGLVLHGCEVVCEGYAGVD